MGKISMYTAILTPESVDLMPHFEDVSYGGAETRKNALIQRVINLELQPSRATRSLTDDLSTSYTIGV
jgi:hypothetical protein